MGWFKDTVEERLNALERKVLVLTLDKERREQRDRERSEAADLTKEGQYIGEIIRMDQPQIMSSGWRVTFVVKVPGILDYARVSLIVDHKGAADAMYAVRASYVGRTVRLNARHRAIPPYRDPNACGDGNPRIIVAWSIDSWMEVTSNEGC